MTREEAIKAIKAWDFLDNDEKEAIETIIPELKESEDERIEKEIIAFLKENLETGRADKTWSLSGLKRWIAWLEKQSEQKPTWTEEDEDYLNDLERYFINLEPLKHKAVEAAIWLKSLKQRMEEQQWQKIKQ
jgi:hypothetical protein